VKRRSARHLVLLLLVSGTTFLNAGNVCAATPQKRVLVLHSTRQDSQITRLADRDLPRLLNDRLSQNVDYYAEYMDPARLSDVTLETTLRQLLERKYSDRTFDLVITIEDLALDFVRKYRSQLFPATPIVFSSADQGVSRPLNATGLIVDLNLAGTLDLALDPAARTPSGVHRDRRVTARQGIRTAGAHSAAVI
jgi:hypothetical protein